MSRADLPALIEAETARGPAGEFKIRRRPRFRPSSIPVVVIAFLMSVVWIFPAYWMVNTSLKPRKELMTVTPNFIPEHPTLANYATAFTQGNFLQYLGNSLVVVGATIAFALLLAVFAAAGLARFRFRGRRTIMVSILIVQMLPGTAFLIPQFVIFKEMGLLDTYYGLILAYVASVLPISIWMLRGFFLAIPDEVVEAAEIDGASTWRTLRSVLFPLVAPGVVTTSIFSFISAWNEYIFAYTFMKDPARYTLPIWLVSFKGLKGVDYGSQMAAATIFALPVVIFFLIIQRNIIAGMSVGAVK